MLCPTCGKENPEENSFCVGCGCQFDYPVNNALHSDSTQNKEHLRLRRKAKTIIPKMIFTKKSFKVTVVVLVLMAFFNILSSIRYEVNFKNTRGDICNYCHDVRSGMFESLEALRFKAFGYKADCLKYPMYKQAIKEADIIRQRAYQGREIKETIIRMERARNNNPQKKYLKLEIDNEVEKLRNMGLVGMLPTDAKGNILLNRDYVRSEYIMQTMSSYKDNINGFINCSAWVRMKIDNNREKREFNKCALSEWWLILRLFEYEDKWIVKQLMLEYLKEKYGDDIIDSGVRKGFVEWWNKNHAKLGMEKITNEEMSYVSGNVMGFIISLSGKECDGHVPLSARLSDDYNEKRIYEELFALIVLASKNDSIIKTKNKNCPTNDVLVSGLCLSAFAEDRKSQRYLFAITQMNSLILMGDVDLMEMLLIQYLDDGMKREVDMIISWWNYHHEYMGMEKIDPEYVHNRPLLCSPETFWAAGRHHLLADFAKHGVENGSDVQNQ